VDTAPLLEREFAEAAGLGWVGKNTLLLNRRWGSYFFLAALLTDLPLEVDPPQEKGYCGTCRACLDACPTGAFPQPYVLDARRCISYLTIEHRGDIEPALAAELGDWMFGCDICQEVCPWNRRAEASPQAIPDPLSSLAPADLVDLLQLDEQAFRARYRKTPLWRAKRRGVLRNACLVLGNQRYQPAVPALEALTGDSESVIQNAARWALERIQSSPCDPRGED
jgi:epoxyqueuosine reductase